MITVKNLRKLDKAKLIRQIQTQQSKNGGLPTPFKELMKKDIKELAEKIGIKAGKDWNKSRRKNEEKSEI